MAKQTKQIKLKSLSTKLFFILFTLSVISISYSDALLQEAGSITVNVTPGQTQSFTWGLQSDDDKTITVEITAEQLGSEFLNFPSSLQIEPGEVVFVPVDVSIPTNYNGEKILSPTIVATEYGDAGASTVINIQMAKTITILISDEKEIQVDLVEEIDTSAESNNADQIQGQVTITDSEEISPLKQIKQGIMPRDVSCREGFQLLLKPNDGSPVCVTQKTLERLVDRGWVLP